MEKILAQEHGKNEFVFWNVSRKFGLSSFQERDIKSVRIFGKKNNTIGEMVFCFQNCSALMWEKNCSSDWEKHLKFEGKVKNWSYQKMNMLIFGKKSTNFVSLSLKLDNPNCHNCNNKQEKVFFCCSWLKSSPIKTHTRWKICSFIWCKQGSNASPR